MAGRNTLNGYKTSNETMAPQLLIKSTMKEPRENIRIHVVTGKGRSNLAERPAAQHLALTVGQLCDISSQMKAQIQNGFARIMSHYCRGSIHASKRGQPPAPF